MTQWFWLKLRFFATFIARRARESSHRSRRARRRDDASERCRFTVLRVRERGDVRRDARFQSRIHHPRVPTFSLIES